MCSSSRLRTQVIIYFGFRPKATCCRDRFRSFTWAWTGLLALELERDGQIPPTAAYTWRNLPLDVGHVLAYFVAHEGHHRGQIVLVARQLGHRLPDDVRNGLWQWTKRAAEARR